ncbi:MAG: thiamine pyrophosphate-binding protein [Beijerinckiaceae bacterium]|nr:thiamine pyrophosphate-binding protein [Beijerinckiaceae bacterium]
MKNALDGGEATLECIRRLGVDYIMSSPGSEWSPIWEAMSRQTETNAPGPRFLDCWHETLAVDMALGYTAVTGRMQAVLLHAGVGLMHGAMGLLTATKSELPLLVMSGESTSFGEDPNVSVEPQWYGGVSEGGAHRFIAPVVKYATHAGLSATLYNTIFRAGEIAQRVPRGPAYVNVAIEAMLGDWKRPEGLRDLTPAPRTAPLSQDVERVANLLRNARNPVIVTESAGRNAEGFAALTAFAETFAIPVTSIRGAPFTNIARSSDMWLGYAEFGMLADSDLILVVEARGPFNPPSKRPGVGDIVVISENPLKTHMGYQVLHADQYLEGDVAASLSMLREAARPGADEHAKIEARRERWRHAHNELLNRLLAEQEKSLSTGRIDAIALAAIAASALPEDAIICDETITHMPVMRAHLPLDEPQSFFRITGGALGQGIGVSLGVKLAAPTQPVVLFVGDGSFLYNPIVQAFGASKAHGVPIIIVVCNNRRYEAMRKGHVIYYTGGVADTTRFHHGVEIDGPEYEDLGSHFGFFGAKASTPSELKEAFAAALAANAEGRTAILNVEMVR